jgi:hypothetical protein
MNALPRHFALVASALLSCAGILAAQAPAGPPAGTSNGKPGGTDFPPFEKVTEGLTKVVSTTDGAEPLYELYSDEKTGKLLAVLPANYESQMLMIAPTVSGGDAEAGVMGGTFYVKWRKFDKKLALVAPNMSVRTDGDKQAKDSVEQLWTDRVLLSLPIVTMKGPRPVIDFGNMATRQASKFFGPGMGFGPGFRSLDASLATLTKAKAFPENIVVEYEAPREDGRLIRVTYNVAKLEGSKGYEPRKADPRVGYFYDWHVDYAKTGRQELADRYITRWNIQKADASLKASPPKEPLVWYIEHTTPIKYRRFVKQGIELWNDAFEEIGIVDALEVYQQDSTTGAHMDKDPEDARYNFFRWNMSDQGYAIGPSRTNPKTGEILDADVVWNQGLTRAVKGMLTSLVEDLSVETFDAETLAWFSEHPEWDPRVRTATGAEIEQMKLRRRLDLETAARVELESALHPWTMGLNDPANTACRIGNRLSMDISLASGAFAAGLLSTNSGGEDEEGESVEMLDDVPMDFLGSMIRYISAHEVGHCIGLQHNMAASTIRTLEEINTPGYEGATVGSVMDYVAVNLNHELGEVQGPYATQVLGPYDHWAVAYGYGPADELEKVLARVSEPDLIFMSQAAMGAGKDPRNATWELGKNNLNFCESRLGLTQELRGKLVSDIVEDGESWAVARRRYKSLLGTHMSALFAASGWLGGSYSNYDFKGDAGDRAPIEDVPAAEQRRALNLIIENAFEDSAFGITPELVRHLGKEHWWDPDGMSELREDPSFTVHDQVGSFHAIGLSLLLSPATLRRVYDNEFRTAEADDSLTMAEVIEAVTRNVWREVAAKEAPSSFRRNLQREHVDRLTDLALLESTSPSMRAISTLATQQLREIDGWAEAAAGSSNDAYTEAHLADVRTRIEKALEASYVMQR